MFTSHALFSCRSSPFPNRNSNHREIATKSQVVHATDFGAKTTYKERTSTGQGLKVLGDKLCPKTFLFCISKLSKNFSDIYCRISTNLYFTGNSSKAMYGVLSSH